MKLKSFLKLHPTAIAMVVIIAIVCAVSLYLGENKVALVEGIIGVCLTVLVFLSERRSFSDLQKTVEEITGTFSDDKNILSSSIPLPYVICEDSGSIFWYNTLFGTDILEGKKLSQKQITHFIPEDQFPKKGANAHFNAIFGERRYTVYVSPVELESGSVYYVLCFVDDTVYKDAFDEYNRTRPVVMNISIDGSEDVSSKISANEFSVLMSDAERIVYEWYERYRCVIKKLSDGKFFVICDKSEFDKMISDKFSVLERIRNHSVSGINANFTISVGAATGMSVDKCDEEAKKALEMAKGSGGDHLVINDSDKFKFVGGVSSDKESQSQVRSKTVAGSLENLMKSAEQIYIMGHKNSDLDALGSAIGLYEAARYFDIKARIVVDLNTTMAKPLINYYGSAYGQNMFISPEKAKDEFRSDFLLIVTDIMRKDFTECPELVSKADKIAIVDHHRMSVDHIENTDIFFHVPNCSSASELVTELVRYMPSKPKISKEASEALLSGIYLDTKNFTIKTGVRTFEAAAYLRDIGADTVEVRKLFSATSEENKIVNEIVNSAEIEDNFAYASVKPEVKNAKLAAAKAADDLLNIERVDASFVIFPISSSEYGISARSYGKVNVQLIMEKLGGGGHYTMAASQIKDTDLETCIEKLKQAVSEYKETL